MDFLGSFIGVTWHYSDSIEQTISTIKIGDWLERFALENGVCSPGKWLSHSWPVEVNNVNIELGKLWQG